MRVFEATTISELYPDLLHRVLDDGEACAPRSLPTREIRNVTIVLHAPEYHLLHVSGRVLNTPFAIADALWILSGSDEPWIFDFNTALRRYANDGRLHGAYGPRLRHWGGTVDQLAVVRQMLLTSPETRRAAIQIFDPSRDFVTANDIPCTLGYRFSMRNGKLDMITSMRSQDAWLGLPYDIFFGTLLRSLLCGWLNVQAGRYVHSVDSLHLYDSDLDRASRVESLREDTAPARFRVAWSDLDDVIKRTVNGGAFADEHDAFHQASMALASYRQWKAGDTATARSLAQNVTTDLGLSLRRWYALLEQKGGRAPCP